MRCATHKTGHRALGVGHNSTSSKRVERFENMGDTEKKKEEKDKDKVDIKSLATGNTSNEVTYTQGNNSGVSAMAW